MESGQESEGRGREGRNEGEENKGGGEGGNLKTLPSQALLPNAAPTR